MMAHKNPPSDNVFVGDLPASITKEFFEQVMSAYGTVTSCRTIPAKPPGNKASGLVRFASVEEASWVVDNLNGNLAEGLTEPIVCRFANAPGSKDGGVGPQPGGWGGAPKPAWGAPQQQFGGGGAPAPGGDSPSDNVFFGSLPAQITKETFEAIIRGYGTVTSCRVFAPKTPTGKGSALARFGSVEEAAWIVANLNGNLVEGLEEPIVCRYANSGTAAAAPGAPTTVPAGGAWGAAAAPGGSFRAAPYPQGGKGGGKGKGGGGSFYHLFGAVKKAGLLGDKANIPVECQVFVTNLPKDTCDADLYRLFSPFGAIAPTGVKAMSHEDGSCKGFGFVDFCDPQSAAIAVQTLNGFQINETTSLGVALKQKKPAAA
mmetsp:Transcript_5833/g.8273  ORF Transcript_5833/g.8273 Transcript_5833/m.8273 type:complete len:373 (-) Transcript_5833:128-1246(-)|eukprot:CAMPEP_0194775940 /NCGR_PEP_ID=MMETSP0323_2-20130528/61705_1 /TAXON_ID=2866 ORGANISM="Crypthecodinium cohnii, Strain Seligo" /NCGR_SAMPLE_ID=MMETSP0323_2 /ASSEMBLY_ACC=CAM_ASM_000346 /LENGTH=372 /DNA_ID=CAMNT_0039712127 /DNA_START=89 /DNA_END=1207 /DNA_ORIENTATION=+